MLSMTQKALSLCKEVKYESFFVHQKGLLQCNAMALMQIGNVISLWRYKFDITFHSFQLKIN